jgi:hypothetical protein
MIAMAAGALEPRGWLSSARGARFDRRAARQLYGLSLWLEMMGLAGTSGAIALRFLLLSPAGLAALGAFTAAFEMSAAFLSPLTAPLQMYHLASLSTTRAAEEKRRMLEAFLFFPRTPPRRRGRRPDRRESPSHPAAILGRLRAGARFPGLVFPGLYIQALSSGYGSAMLAAGLGRKTCWVEAARSGTFVALTAAALFVADDPSLIGPAFLVTRALGLWLAARTKGRSYGTRPEEPIGGRLRRLVPAVAVVAVAAAGTRRPGFDWTLAALAGNALLVLAAAVV